MKISVIIPLYNKEKTISRAIESLISQSFKNWELIIVNDGSTDNSINAIKKIYDKRIRVISQINKGVGSARNLGVENATTEWVAFLDADDTYCPDFLEECKRIILSDRDYELSFVSSNYFKKWECNKLSIVAFDESIVDGKRNYFKMCTGDKTPVCSSSVIVNKKIFQSIGGFPVDMHYFEDWIIWMKLALNGTYYFISKPLSNYYKESTGVSQSKEIDCKELYRCAVKLAETAKKIVDSKEDGTDSKEDVIKYMNSFLICESRSLARRGMIFLSIKLLQRLDLLYMDKTMIIKATGVLKAYIKVVANIVLKK